MEPALNALEARTVKRACGWFLRCVLGIAVGLGARSLDATGAKGSHQVPPPEQPNDIHKHLLSMTGPETENYCLLLDFYAELLMGWEVAKDKIDRALQDAAGWERVWHQQDYVDFRFVEPACRDDINAEEGDPELRIVVLAGNSHCPGYGSCLVGGSELPKYNPLTGHWEYRSIALSFYYSELQLETCGLPRPQYTECLHHTVNHVVGQALGLVPGGAPCGTSVMHDWDHGCPSDIPAWPTQEDIVSVQIMTPIPHGGWSNFSFQGKVF